MRQFESDRLRAKLLFLPEQLMAEVAKDLESGRFRFVEAQVAIAIDIQLAIPLRPQNLSSFNWRRHFSEPDGPKGRLLLHIPAAETKSKRAGLTSPRSRTMSPDGCAGTGVTSCRASAPT